MSQRYLPQHVLDAIIKEKVEYLKDDPNGPFVRIPLNRKPTRVDIGILAIDFVRSLPEGLSGRQIHIDVSATLDGTGEFLAQYFIIDKPVGSSAPILQKPNYRIYNVYYQSEMREFTYGIAIRRGRICTHSFEILEAYAKRIRTNKDNKKN